MKRVGVAALAAGASALAIDSHAEQTDWSATYDWICVGSGMAGCAGAIAGSDRGMKTLLIEKADKLGGELRNEFSRR